MTPRYDTSMVGAGRRVERHAGSLRHDEDPELQERPQAVESSDPAPQVPRATEEAVESALRLAPVEHGHAPTTRVTPWRFGGRSEGTARDLTDGQARRGLEQALERPLGHDLAPSEELAAAWTDVVATVNTALAEISGLQELVSERGTARSEHLREVEAAAAAGRPVPKKKPARDEDALIAERTAIARGVIARAHKARARYDELAEVELGRPERLQALADQLAKSHELALKAVASAAEKVREADAALAALVALGGRHGLERNPEVSLGALQAQERLSEAEKVLQRFNAAVPALVDARESGVSIAERQALAMSADPSEQYSLLMLERHEAYRVSSFTKGWSMAPIPGAKKLTPGHEGERY